MQRHASKGSEITDSTGKLSSSSEWSSSPIVNYGGKAKSQSRLGGDLLPEKKRGEGGNTTKVRGGGGWREECQMLGLEKSGEFHSIVFFFQVWYA